MKNIAKTKIPKGYVRLKPLQTIKAGDLCQWETKSGRDDLTDYFQTCDAGRRLKKKDMTYIRKICTA